MQTIENKFLLFLWGVLLSCILFVPILGCDNQKQSAASDREIDLALGNAEVDWLSSQDTVLQLLMSNRVSEAKAFLVKSTWWEVENAWSINKKYKGALDDELNPLLKTIYPQLRNQIDLNRFTNSFPNYLLVEMTNFMIEADNITDFKAIESVHSSQNTQGVKK